jgi:nitrogen fixation NifU-like protein
MRLDQMYQEVILDHYRRPKHRGLQSQFDSEAHHVNPTCGDEVTVRLTLRDGDKGLTVDEVSYEAQGCSISQASTSVMTELVTGQPLDDALHTEAEFLALLQGRGETVGDEDVLGDAIAFSGVAKYPARVKCALLGWMAFKDAAARAALDKEHS